MSLKIAIIGGGTAGCSTALLCHRLNHTVKLFERVPNPKPEVGAGFLLQPSGMFVLNKIGILEQLIQQSTKINRLYGVTQNDKTVLDLRYQDLYDKFYGLGVNRNHLFKLFYDLIRHEGIEIQTGAGVSRITNDLDTGKSRVLGEGVDEGGFDLVVVASGAFHDAPLIDGTVSEGIKSRTVKKYPFGALWTLLYPQKGELDDFINTGLLYNQYNTSEYMVGLLPTGGTHATLFWSLQVDEYQNTVDKGIDHLKRLMVEKTPGVEPFIHLLPDMEKLKFASYGDIRMKYWHTSKDHGDHSVVFIGDAAHACSPQLGQGTNLALLDSYTLAGSLSRFSDKNGTRLSEALQNYSTSRKDSIRFYQVASSALTPVFQGTNKSVSFLRDNFMWPVTSTIPFLYQQNLLSLNGVKSGLISNLPLEEYKSLFDKL